MPSQSRPYVGLDVGSTKVVCIVGVEEPGSPVPSIRGVGTAVSEGLRKGVVVDLEETIQSIGAALEDAQRVSGQVIDHVTIGIDGAHIISLNSKGVIAVSGNNREISLDDLHRVEEAATVIQLPPNREIIQVFPRNYRLDGQDNIKDPIGMAGVRLEVDAHIITGSTPALKNLQRCVYQAGLTIDGQVVVAIAAARAVLDKRQREIGTAIVDIGGGTTSLAVFEEGEVMHSATLPIGGAHLTNDLAIGLRTDLETAETVKLQHAHAFSGKNKQRLVEIKETNGNVLNVKQSEIDMIVRARLDELFHLVNRELEKVHRAGQLPGGIVLTGGGANMEAIDDYVKDKLRLPAFIGKPSGFSGIVDVINDPRYATAVGLMLEDIYHTEHQLQPTWHIDLGGGKQFLSNLINRFKP